MRLLGAPITGYTLVELVAVIAIGGIIAATIAPRFFSQQTFTERGYADELAAALRSAQKAAVISGCPVRVNVSASGYAATQQAAAGNACNPADTTWSVPLLGADGAGIQGNTPAGTTVSPTGSYQFDTQGRVSSNPGLTLSVGSHTLSIDAASGYILVQ